MLKSARDENYQSITGLERKLTPQTLFPMPLEVAGSNTLSLVALRRQRVGRRPYLPSCSDAVRPLMTALLFDVSADGDGDKNTAKIGISSVDVLPAAAYKLPQLQRKLGYRSSQNRMDV